jgi:hypothetical protein
MRKSAGLILDRSLLVLPFTATLTVVTTVVICHLKDMRQYRSANYYERTNLTSFNLSVGLAILLPQMLIIIIGRLRLLLETQSLMNRIILYIIHIIALIPLIGGLLMACVEIVSGRDGYQFGFTGKSVSLYLYCALHTIYILYLYIRERNAFQWSKIMGPIWFLACPVLVIPCFILREAYNINFPVNLIFIFPVLYCLGFVYPFWLRAKARSHSSIIIGPLAFLNDPDQETLVSFPI